MIPDHTKLQLQQIFSKVKFPFNIAPFQRLDGQQVNQQLINQNEAPPGNMRFQQQMVRPGYPGPLPPMMNQGGLFGGGQQTGTGLFGGTLTQPPPTVPLFGARPPAPPGFFGGHQANTLFGGNVPQPPPAGPLFGARQAPTGLFGGPQGNTLFGGNQMFNAHPVPAPPFGGLQQQTTPETGLFEPNK